MNAPTKITLYRPTFQGDHTVKISLPPVPGTTDAKRQTYGKTPLEVYQERRIATGRQGRDTRTPSPPQREEITQVEVIAQLANGPKTAAEVCRALNVSTERAARVLTEIRKSGQIKNLERRGKSGSLLWAMADYHEVPGQRRDYRHKPMHEHMAMIAENARKRRERITDLIEDGRNTAAAISEVTGDSVKVIAEILRTMMLAGAVTRESVTTNQGRFFVYEVAQ